MQNILGVPTPNSSKLAEILLQLRQITTSNDPTEMILGDCVVSGDQRLSGQENHDPRAAQQVVEQAPSNMKPKEQLKQQRTLNQQIQMQETHEQRTQLQDECDLEMCNCKKSKCLKLYCQCFAAQATCTSSCKCTSCENDSTDNLLRVEAIRATLERNPTAFDSKYRPTVPYVVSSVAHKIGCRCRKSMCLKKYCECFQGSVLCSSICTCLTCHNNVDHFKKESKVVPQVNDQGLMDAPRVDGINELLLKASPASFMHEGDARLHKDVQFTQSSKLYPGSSGIDRNSNESSCVGATAAGDNPEVKKNATNAELFGDGVAAKTAQPGNDCFIEYSSGRDGIACKTRPPLNLPLKRRPVEIVPGGEIGEETRHEQGVSVFSQYGLVEKKTQPMVALKLASQSTPVGTSPSIGLSLFPSNEEDAIKQKILENLLYKELENQGLLTMSATPGGPYGMKVPGAAKPCQEKIVATPSSAAIALVLGGMHENSYNSSSSQTKTSDMSYAGSSSTGTALMTEAEKNMTIEQANLATYSSYSRYETASPNSISIAAALTLLSRRYLNQAPDGISPSSRATASKTIQPPGNEVHSGLEVDLGPAVTLGLKTEQSCAPLSLFGDERAIISEKKGSNEKFSDRSQNEVESDINTFSPTSIADADSAVSGYVADKVSDHHPIMKGKKRLVSADLTMSEEQLFKKVASSNGVGSTTTL